MITRLGFPQLGGIGRAGNQVMIISDSYGRDLNWLRIQAPKRCPSLFSRALSVFCFVQSVELWDSLQECERFAAAVPSFSTGQPPRPPPGSYGANGAYGV